MICPRQTCDAIGDGERTLLCVGNDSGNDQGPANLPPPPIALAGYDCPMAYGCLLAISDGKRLAGWDLSTTVVIECGSLDRFRCQVSNDPSNHQPSGRLKMSWSIQKSIDFPWDAQDRGVCSPSVRYAVGYARIRRLAECQSGTGGPRAPESLSNRRGSLSILSINCSPS